MASSGRERGALYLMISLLGALLAAMLIFQLVRDARSTVSAQKPVENSEVVVASKSIAPGWTITADHLQTRKLPEPYIPDEVYRTPEEVIGRVAMERILYGEFIREERLADPEAGVGLTAIIPRGMRAYQVKLRGGQQVSGFLNPGNFVDVIAVCEEADPPDARTILQSVTVLAVNDRMVDMSYDPDEAGGKGKKKKVKPSVTLALTPEDTQKVKQADNDCEISLGLRNDIDVTNIQSNEQGSQPSANPSGPSPATSEPSPPPPGSTGAVHPSLRPTSPPRGVAPRSASARG